MKDIVFNVTSLTHLNIIGRTSICYLSVDMLLLLKESSRDIIYAQHRHPRRKKR